MPDSNISLDNPESGLDAALALQAKLSLTRPDLKVVVKRPPAGVADWNDLHH